MNIVQSLVAANIPMNSTLTITIDKGNKNVVERECENSVQEEAISRK